MAKRSGGFGGGRIPGNMQNMLKQAQRMQAEMQQNKAKLDDQEFTGSAGGGAVKVTVTGGKSVKSVVLDKEAVDPEDVETLQDMITAAVNDALGQVDAASEQLFGGMGQGLGL
jgi:DNA-binding YbaB/EbfC family protein